LISFSVVPYGTLSVTDRSYLLEQAAEILGCEWVDFVLARVKFCGQSVSQQEYPVVKAETTNRRELYREAVL
jgi:hypothetical protein